MKLSEEEMMSIFHTALCDGLSYMNGYELRLDYHKGAYSMAKNQLVDPAFEDVLVQILKDGGMIALKDGEDVYSIIESSVYERMPYVPFHNVLNILNEDYDVMDADCVLQTIFLKDILFG